MACLPERSEPMNPQSKNRLDALDSMLASAGVLQALVSPLQHNFGITNCGYLHLYENGDSFYLSNQVQFQEALLRYFLESHDMLAIFPTLNYLKNFGFYLLDADPQMKQQIPAEQHALFERYNTHHQFFSFDKIETKRGRACRLIIYSAPEERSDTNHFYLNNLELMRRINNYLTRELDETIDKVKMTTPLESELSIVSCQFQKSTACNTSNIKNYIHQSHLHYPKHQALSDIKLSDREKEVVRWFLLGKSNSQTAKIMNVSVTTVVTYFDRLKKKFSCYSKSQLLLKLIDGEFIRPEDWESIYY